MSVSTSTQGRSMVLTAAILGWMFDGLEMGLFPLVANPALRDLLNTTNKEAIEQWNAIITALFLVGAATGGVVFGWLGDRMGRVRAMTLSVLVYALFSGVCGLATQAWQVAVFRFIASLGMGGEWSLGVALVMEVWPNRSRLWLAGVIGAAANFGYLIIGAVGLILNQIIGDLQTWLLNLGMGAENVEWLTRNSGWRILMLLGTTPALLTFFIRLFVPESQRWQEEHLKGATSYWRTRDLISVLMGALACCTMIWLWTLDWANWLRISLSVVLIVLITLCYLYPVKQYVKRAEAAQPNVCGGWNHVLGRLLLAAVLSGVALLGTWGCVQQAPKWIDQITQGNKPDAKAYLQMASAFGACLGCILAALLGGLLGRQITYALLCLGSMGAIWNMYQYHGEWGQSLLLAGFLMGFITAAFYGWLPLYLPELFRTSIRATGQGFGFNFGRILASIGVLQLPVIMKEFQLTWSHACSLLAFVYLIGFFLIWFAPETKGKPLPE